METGEISLSDREFDALRKKMYLVAGISMSDAKRTLVVSRLSKILREHKLTNFSEYLHYLDHRATPNELQQFVNALTTNLTRFFREDHHFAHLVDYVGKLVRDSKTGDGRRRLRIWSAGCSTGQEPFTIALSLLDAYPELTKLDFKILATDIDTNVLQKARLGIFRENDLADLSPERARLFEYPGDGVVKIPEKARSLITFKPLNLMEDWPMRGPFDAIFCRNVAIYFNKQTQENMFIRMGELLARNAFIYIGHSENLSTVADRFKLVGKTIYQNRIVKAARRAA